MWDIPSIMQTYLAPSNNYRYLYCPSNFPQNPSAMWTLGSKFGESGYFFMIRRIAILNGAIVDDTVGNGVPNPCFPTLSSVTYLDLTTKKYTDVVTNTTLSAGTTVLETDATLCQNGSFTNVGGTITGLSTDHLGNRGIPAGRNILYLDYHAEWKGYPSAGPLPSSPTALDWSGVVGFFW